MDRVCTFRGEPLGPSNTDAAEAWTRAVIEQTRVRLRKCDKVNDAFADIERPFLERELKEHQRALESILRQR